MLQGTTKVKKFPFIKNNGKKILVSHSNTSSNMNDSNSDNSSNDSFINVIDTPKSSIKSNTLIQKDSQQDIVPKINTKAAAATSTLPKPANAKNQTGNGDSSRYVCDMYKNKQLLLDQMVSHNFGLQDINSGIDLMKSGECLRILINMNSK